MTIDAAATPPGARNATLADLARLLRGQQARKTDIVAPAAAIRASGGRLVVDDSAPELGPDGVTMTAGSYLPTEVCDQGIADKLGMYRDRLRAAEMDYVRSLVRDIESGTLDGVDWWRQVRERGFDQVPPPFDPSYPHDTSRPGD